MKFLVDSSPNYTPVLADISIVPMPDVKNVEFAFSWQFEASLLKP